MAMASVHDGTRIPGGSSACGQDTKKLPDVRRLNVGPDHEGSLTFNDLLDEATGPTPIKYQRPRV